MPLDYWNTICKVVHGKGVGRQVQHERLPRVSPSRSDFRAQQSACYLQCFCPGRRMVKLASWHIAGSSGAAAELPSTDKQHPLWRPAPDLPHEPPAPADRPLAGRTPGHPQAHLRADLLRPRAQARLQEPAQSPRASHRAGQTVHTPPHPYNNWADASLLLFAQPNCTVLQHMKAASPMCCNSVHYGRRHRNSSPCVLVAGT